MSKWIAEFDLEDGDTMPEHMDLNYMGGKIDFHCRPMWIPVSERLPEERQSVLVWCPQYKNIYCAYINKEHWWIFGAVCQSVPNEVVAWMPLPNEPQESEE